jgi:hypothetical protein
MTALARIFPVVEPLKASETDRVELVNQTTVEEVLQDLGYWTSARERGRDEHRHLARARHAPSDVRRVRVRGQVPAPGRTP